MKTLLIIIISFVLLSYLSKLFFRYVFPKLMQKYMQRMMERMQKRGGMFGEINEFPVNPSKKTKFEDDKKTKGSDSDGEYIDFEEIK